MKWVRLKSVYGARFRSFTEPFRVEFPESGLTAIRGLNKNTGDTSNSGKSSLILAVSYLFGGCPFPGTELQSWYDEEPFLVGAEIDTPDGVWVVERSPGLKVFSPSKVVTKGKAAESVIDSIFGMDATTRALTTYRGQDEKGMFLSMPDSEKKEFLSSALGLKKYESAATASSEALRQLKAGLVAAQASEATYAEAYRAAEDKLKEISGGIHFDSVSATEDAEEEVELKEELRLLAELKKGHQENVSAIRADIGKALSLEISSIQNRIQALSGYEESADVSGLKSLIRQAISKATELERADLLKQEGLRKERDGIKAELKDVSVAAATARRLQNDIGLLQSQLSKINEQTCPTCMQSWVESTAAAEKIKNDLNIKTEELKSAIDNASRLKGLEESLVVAEQRIKDFQPLLAIGELKTSVRDWETALAAKGRAAADNRKNEVAALHSEERVARQAADIRFNESISDIKAAILSIDKNVAGIKDKLAAIASRQQDRSLRDALFKERCRAAHDSKAKHLAAAESLVSINKRYDEESDFGAMVGREGFLGVIFDDVLAEISAATNDILGRVANVRHITFGFESERETQSGNFQRRIVPVVTVDGKRVGMASGVSGGQKSAINLAVDLGVAEVIAKRRGSYPGWLILDEVFDGLGRVSKESCLEMLNAYAGDKLILVIDHGSEFQGLFSQTISVIMSGNQSIIERN